MTWACWVGLAALNSFRAFLPVIFLGAAAGLGFSASLGLPPDFSASTASASLVALAAAFLNYLSCRGSLCMNFASLA